MASTRRPRRALLFVPGTERARIEKAAALGADGVIVDLEDAVADARKDEARASAVRALAEVDFGASERVVRVNAAGSGFEADDWAALAGAPVAPDAVMLPKVERAGDVLEAGERLAALERRLGLPDRRIRVLALLETARGIVRAGEIAASDPRLDALVFGAEDLCADVGGTRTRAGAEVATARSLVVLHAAAERLQALDTPFIDLADTDALVADTRAALELGYHGKLAIHPRQLAPIVGVFTPSPDELAAATRLVDAFAAHRREGRGVFNFEGKMIDLPMVRAAERVLARARAAGLVA